jgi:hypothetical protein
MKLWFKGSDDKRRLIGDFDTESEARKVINKYCADRNFVIYYIRNWASNGLLMYDVGSHTEFFELEVGENYVPDRE